MKVAVKFFIKAGETRDIAVLLNRMEKGECNFYDTYNQIRTEVAVLSKLRHPNLTHLEGVTMQPHPALLLPLAPHGSLHQVLKEYSSAEASVLPLTMQACATQVGATYLTQPSCSALHGCMSVCLYVCHTGEQERAIVL